MKSLYNSMLAAYFISCLIHVLPVLNGLKEVPDEKLVTVTTNEGEVVGKRVKVPVTNVNINDNLYLTRFYGIPFAEPPTGHLRFKAPVKARPWVGKRLALDWGNSCVQYIPDIFKAAINVTSAISEDCLYLNVWVPDPVPESAAVMVYIYGGGFTLGSTAFTDFTTFAATQNVIVVSMNYRVSSLGFLYFGTEGCPGNMGLMDQDLALRWVQDNIDRFGGDPKRVTIFGISAGSVSTGHHLLNPNSAKLFRRAILQSGSPVGSWGRDTLSRGLEKSMKLAEKVGCANSSDLALVVECLKSVDSSVLVRESAGFGEIITMFHYPVVDNRFVFDVERATGGLRDKEVILGVTSTEGGMWANLLLITGQARPESMFETFAEIYLGSVNSHLLRSIRYYYKDHCDRVKRYGEEIATTRFASDFLFTCDTTKLADTLAEAAVKTYLYQVTHKPRRDRSPVWVEADHGSDAIFLVGLPELEGPEAELSRRIMTYFSSFAKHGDPNVESADNNANFGASMRKALDPWSPYTVAEKNRLDIALNRSSRRQDALQEDQCRFWRHDFPLLQRN